jgi:hypothetical protein
MKALSDAAMRDPARLVPFVQAHWGRWEAALMAAVERNGPGPAEELRARVETVIRSAQRLRDELAQLP